MYNSYVAETIARQRLEETARQARTAHRRLQTETRAGWHFPTVNFLGRRTTTVRPA